MYTDIKAEIEKEILLDLFHQAFNADAESMLRYHISLQKRKLPPNKFKRLEAELLTIHNTIVSYYQDAGLEEYALNKKARK
ncbi:MAG: hypothetical protein QXS81_05015 [Candidatus Micrarchaeaceae archaeon]